MQQTLASSNCPKYHLLSLQFVLCTYQSFIIRTEVNLSSLLSTEQRKNMAQSSYQYIYSQMSLYKGVEGGAEGGVENSRFQSWGV